MGSNAGSNVCPKRQRQAVKLGAFLHTFQGPARCTHGARPVVSCIDLEQDSVLYAPHLDVHGGTNLRGDVACFVPAIDSHQVLPGPALRRRPMVADKWVVRLEGLTHG